MVRIWAAERPVEILDDSNCRSAGPAFVGREELFKKGVKRRGFPSAQRRKGLVLKLHVHEKKGARLLTGWIEFQTERLRPEDPLIHCFQCIADAERYVGLSKHVALQIDSRSNFDDRQAFLLETQHATFRCIQHILLKLSCSAAAKGDMLNLRHEFSV